MKRKLFVLLTLIGLCFSFTSCIMPEETYTVYTVSYTYSEYVNIYNDTLNDGMYWKSEISRDQWDSYELLLANQDYNEWTEKKIYKWLIGRNFGESEATKESSWLTTIDHGLIVSRSGNIVSMLFK